MAIAVLILEILLVIAVVLLQLYFFNSTYQRIKLLSNLFPTQNLDESFLQSSDTSNGVIQLIRIDRNLYSEEFTNIINSINNYLKKNQGATDFSIIESIVERNIETRENAVSSNVTLPLYIGLMGTFTGIIMGLLRIGFGGGVSDENINSFIGGVVIAMIASFLGLLLTVLNNSKNFKEAKAICDTRKNSFYDFLQAVLLPHLGNSLYDALDRLKFNINDFNKKFENNIQLFDTKFSDNISSLRTSVESLSGNIGAVVENTRTQKEFLVELKNIGYNRMAEANVRVFQLLKETGPTFIKFIEKQKELTYSVEQAVSLVQFIDSIFNRIKTFEESLNNLGESINQSHFLGNDLLKRVDTNLKYLNDKFELLKRFEDANLAETETYFKNKYADIQRLTDNIKREVESALDIKIENNPLQKLHLLDTIDKHMSEIKSKINYNSEFKQISDDLSLTKSELSDIKQKLTKAIEENRSKKSQKNNRKEKSRDEDKVKEPPKNKSNLFSQFTNLFKRNSGREE
ncbi:hypothetical protein [Runella sp.]|uniref:hypothetical protein n=1 Tax=Runella sp. TaxID=1960881 RepID=UPI003D119258